MSYRDLPHLRSNGASLTSAQAPSIAAGAAAGTSPTVAVAGYDERGLATVTAGSTGVTTGVLATITFATPYTVAPDAVVLTDGGGTGVLGTIEIYATVTTTALTLHARVAPTGSDVYKVNYLVVGGA